MSTVKKLHQMLCKSQRVVFFGGAGVSTESGIPDYRSSGGSHTVNFEGLPPSHILDIEFFNDDPETFYKFYKKNKIFNGVEPNITHRWLVELEQAGKLSGIVTQNIDGLHTKAGSKNVVELHGSVLNNYCTICGHEYSLEDILASSSAVPYCLDCNGIIRPSVVLFGEGLKSSSTLSAIELLSSADMLIVAGTSLKVYPAAGFLTHFTGKYMVIINNDKTDYDQFANLVINCQLGDVISDLLTLNGNHGWLRKVGGLLTL